MNTLNKSVGCKKEHLACGYDLEYYFILKRKKKVRNCEFYQEANWTFFKLNCRLLSSRIARSQLGIENEAPQLALINVSGRI
jgi:hypothetical protein